MRWICERTQLLNFSAPSVYPVITFGPLTSPAAVLTSLSHAIVFMLARVESVRPVEAGETGKIFLHLSTVILFKNIVKSNHFSLH